MPENLKDALIKLTEYTRSLEVFDFSLEIFGIERFLLLELAQAEE